MQIKPFWNKKTISFKYILFCAFLLLFVLPVIGIQVSAYYNNVRMVRHTMQEAANQNLLQTQKNLQVALSSYDYMLYQLYTERKLIDLIDAINNTDHVAENSLLLTQMLSNAIYGQSYVQAITVITENKQVIIFDRLKGSQHQHSWIKDASMPISHIYNQTLRSSKSYMFSTTSGKDFSGQIYHYVHIAHPVMDYKNAQKKKGIVILSIDADVLNKESNAGLAFHPKDDDESFCFILDQNNNIVSFPKAEFIGKNILSMNDEDIRQACREFVQKNGLMEGNDIDVQVLNDTAMSWKIVRVSNNKILMEYINRQYKNVAITMLLVTMLLGCIMFVLNRKVIKTLNGLLKEMKMSENDKLVLPGKHSFIKELDGIYQNFSRMLKRINTLIERIKYITRQQKDAEIKVLESQINPHFLYNSLDMINWMAIDAGEYQISDAVHSLAQILRYAITQINEPVTLAEEVNWMQKYLHLQQMKGKDRFRYEIDMEEAIADCQIYKMLMQPFMENAIVHGFIENHLVYMLEIKIFRDKEYIKIIIRDNGSGISTEKMEDIHSLINHPQRCMKHHIGICNVRNRLLLYYMGKARITVESREHVGTEVILQIPVIREENNEDCNC